jgi:hypothetical protein
MWTIELIAQAIGWGVLIAGFPLIFIYVRKVSTHIAYIAFPRDVLIQYKTKTNTIESYLLKQSVFKKRLIKVSEEKARELGGTL